MQRALPAVLILSLLAGQIGMFGALIGRHHARQRMRRRITTASRSPGDMMDLQYLSLSRADRQSTNSSFTWVDNNREFWYRGNLYDVVSEQWQGDTWHVWVIRDREEEQYLNALAQSIRTPMLDGTTVPVFPRPMGHRPLALVPSGGAPVPSPHVHSRSFPRASSLGHQAPYLEVPHPPPWG